MSEHCPECAERDHVYGSGNENKFENSKEKNLKKNTKNERQTIVLF